MTTREFLVDRGWRERLKQSSEERNRTIGTGPRVFGLRSPAMHWRLGARTKPRRRDQPFYFIPLPISARVFIVFLFALSSHAT